MVYLQPEAHFYSLFGIRAFLKKSTFSSKDWLFFVFEIEQRANQNEQ
ncbi:hypothetical protein VCRA2119O147_650028 [Vibrio crassostreae]|nr:hypothetical protein EDB64_2098 [Vibrio crassostreae]ROP10202.1 hypothetical protein EDB63_1914 [Vibrio crassostreae]ROQ79871.1 hypothetical protein EDB72_2564 [Vibrio crassostreae]ROR85042.1 hypothetical protein EDB66_1906 [Vibrio crassostreae]RPE92963.1 hypothetical protein EDB68_1918 [Vibrio crassostreae]